jgi:hypothetical protein
MTLLLAIRAHAPLLLLLWLLLVVANTACDRSQPAGPSCGAPGTNTVLREGGCYCLAGHVLNDTGTGCVPEMPPVDTDGGVVALDDGGPPPEVDAGHVMGTLREVDTSDGTCGAGCAAVGFPCATSCDEGAGFASYGYYDWDYGWYRGVHQENLASCETTPASSWSDGSETYELGRLVCCCEIPEVTVVAARTSDTRTCDTICTDEGFAGCAGFAEWPNEDTTGGTLATYYRPETGSVTDVVMGCAANPPLTSDIAGAVRQLRDYRCACL